VGGANIPIVHYFDHSYLEEEKSMILTIIICTVNSVHNNQIWISANSVHNNQIWISANSVHNNQIWISANRAQNN
jgi:hypothetical protein